MPLDKEVVASPLNVVLGLTAVILRIYLEILLQVIARSGPGAVGSGGPGGREGAV